MRDDRKRPSLGAPDAWRRRALLWSAPLAATAAWLALLPRSQAAAAATCPEPGIGEADYRAYLKAFNARDMDGFTRFYTDDVVFVLGERAPMHGKAAIIDWYRKAWAKVREHTEVGDMISDHGGLAVELHTTFTAIEDWPDFSTRPLLKGQQVQRIGFAHYRIRDGRIAEVKTAPHRTVAAPWITPSKS